MATVLLTRPDGDNDGLAARLAAAGSRVLVAPMLVERRLPAALPEAAGYAGVIVTSRRAVAALTGDLLQLPVYAVGAATAGAAHDAGCADVQFADGTGAALARQIVAVRPDGPLLYLAARERSPDLEAALAEAGVACDLRVVYGMDAATALPIAVEDALSDGEIDAAAFFSRRTAATFAALTNGPRFDSARAGLVCLAISTVAAEPLVASGFARTRISARPDGAAMDALVMNVATGDDGAAATRE